MARYFGTNTLARGVRSATSVTETTTAGRFNASFGSSSITLPSTGPYYEIGAPFDDASTSLTGTIYVKFDYMQNGFFQSGATLWFAMNGLTNAYRLQATNTGLQMQYWNTTSGAWVNWGSVFAVAPTVGVLYTYLIKLVVNSSFEIYTGASLQASSSTVPTSGVSAVTLMRWMSCNNNGDQAYLSQILCADYNVNDCWIMSRLPTGNGTYTDGTGSYTDVDEVGIDDTDAVGLPAVGNKKTFTKAAITVPSGYKISGIQINARGMVSGGVVTDGKLIAYNSGVKTASTGRSYTGAYTGRGALITNDPATGAAFTQAGFNSCEFGLEAA